MVSIQNIKFIVYLYSNKSFIYDIRANTMNTWGEKMLDTIYSVAGMAAIGLDLNKNIFIDLMKNGPHLLAPTGSNFNKYGKKGTVLAGYHYDLNFLTVNYTL